MTPVWETVLTQVDFKPFPVPLSVSNRRQYNLCLFVRSLYHGATASIVQTGTADMSYSYDKCRMSYVHVPRETHRCTKNIKICIAITYLHKIMK